MYIHLNNEETHAPSARPHTSATPVAAWTVEAGLLAGTRKPRSKAGGSEFLSLGVRWPDATRLRSDDGHIHMYVPVSACA